MNAVAILAGGIGYIREVVPVTGRGDKPAVVEDDLFSLIRIERLAFFAIETGNVLPSRRWDGSRPSTGLINRNKQAVMIRMFIFCLLVMTTPCGLQVVDS